MEKRFYGMPHEEIDKIQAEGKEALPVGRDVSWRVTTELIEQYFPDPERQLYVYKMLLEVLREDNAISKRVYIITPDVSDTSSATVVSLEEYRNRKE